MQQPNSSDCCIVSRVLPQGTASFYFDRILDYLQPSLSRWLAGVEIVRTPGGIANRTFFGRIRCFCMEGMRRQGGRHR